MRSSLFALRLRNALTILFVLGVIATACTLSYLNSTGLNKELRAFISSELAKRQLYVEFDELKLDFNRGVIVDRFKLYENEEKTIPIAYGDQVVLDIDKTKLLRGVQQIDEITFKNTSISLPINHYDPQGSRLELTALNGKIETPTNSRFFTNSLIGNYHGINIAFSGNLYFSEPRTKKKQKIEDLEILALRYQKILNQLDIWQFPKDVPPSVVIHAEGDLSHLEHLRVDYQASSDWLEYNDYRLENVSFRGRLKKTLLTAEQITFTNNGKSAHLSADYDFTNLNGIFEIDSNINIQDFLRQLFDYNIMRHANVLGDFTFSAKGSYQLPDSQILGIQQALPNFMQASPTVDVDVQGKLQLKDTTYFGSQFDQIGTRFSWKNGNIFLDQLSAKNKHGELTGKLLLKKNHVRYDVKSSLPMRAYAPFVKKGSKLAEELSKLKFTDQAAFLFSSKGEITAHSPEEWLTNGTFTAEIHASHFTYETIKGASLTGTFSKNKEAISGNFIATDCAYKDLNAKQLRAQFSHFKNKFDATFIAKDFVFKKLNAAELKCQFNQENDILEGTLATTDFKYEDTPLKRAQAHFYRENGILNVDNLYCEHPEGRLRGGLRFEEEYVRYGIESSIPPKYYLPFVPMKLTREWIKKLEINPQGSIYLSANGKTNLKNPKDWNSKGKVLVKSFKFNNIPVNSTASNYAINRERLILNNTVADLDYTDYPLRKKYKGRRSGTLQLSSVIVDHTTHTVHIGPSSGYAYPAPIARMFHKPTAEHLEQYRMHNPAQFTCQGTFDSIPTKAPKLNFQCNLSLKGTGATLEFLGSDIALYNLGTNITVKPQAVRVRNIVAKTFDGQIEGNLDINFPKNTKSPRFDAFFKFLKLDLRGISNVYAFKEKKKGLLTGNCKLTGLTDHINTLNGSGTISLEKGDLFSAPVLGPLSAILNPILFPFAGKNALSERLKEASANVTIKDGVLATNNIISQTPSFNFAGEGWLNLSNDDINLTIRVNYRGLMGMPMLPIKLAEAPIKFVRLLFTGKKPGTEGFLQFNGSGKYHDPKWTMVPFTPPRDFKNHPLVQAPKAQVVAE